MNFSSKKKRFPTNEVYDEEYLNYQKKATDLVGCSFCPINQPVIFLFDSSFFDMKNKKILPRRNVLRFVAANPHTALQDELNHLISCWAIP